MGGVGGFVDGHGECPLRLEETKWSMGYRKYAIRVRLGKVVATLPDVHTSVSPAMFPRLSVTETLQLQGEETLAFLDNAEASLVHRPPDSKALNQGNEEEGNVVGNEVRAKMS